MGYTKVQEHRDILDKACTACNELCLAFKTDEEMVGKTVSVDAATLFHVYELLLAFAYTHEGYECSCGCMGEHSHEEGTEHSPVAH